MKVLIDMNLSPRWVAFLRANGIEAVRWSEIGKPDARDVEIFCFAEKHGYVILTHDLDFGTLLRYSKQTRPSVVVLRDLDLRPEVSGPLVLQALTRTEEVLRQGALVVVPSKKVRVRPLPF
ncbi:hypothetical protein RmaAA213_28170 [Rhodothermus marinus]|nr:hypothetical protein RmaAA213_28170 [Rhodothermus marinus]BBM73950.1 hypothetical protein RmaAA338_28150 [Rhodothermus marinus]